MTVLTLANKINVSKLKTIRIVRGGFDSGGLCSFFVKGTPKRFKSNTGYYYVKGQKFLALVTGTRSWSRRLDGSMRRVGRNFCLTFGRRYKLHGRRVIGSTLLEMRRRSFFFRFKSIF